MNDFYFHFHKENSFQSKYKQIVNYYHKFKYIHSIHLLLLIFNLSTDLFTYLPTYLTILTFHCCFSKFSQIQGLEITQFVIYLLQIRRPKMDLTGLNQDVRAFPSGSSWNSFSCFFQLLGTAYISWLMASYIFKAATADRVFLTLHHSYTDSSTSFLRV